MLSDIHCFEVTQVVPLAMEMQEACANDPSRLTEMVGNLLFWPAPKVWIEVSSREGRSAMLLVEGKACGEAFWFTKQGMTTIGRFELHEGQGVRQFESEVDASRILSFARSMLYIINSPKIIGRRQHMPHRGLEKMLLNRPHPEVQFPLHAWTEIILEARPTFIDDTGVTHEAHLTGRKCLHFCRAHVRVRNGAMEIVSSHWRGDPALGIKRSRYKVVPPKGGPKE